MKIVVGLGNPGRKYEQTRHNVGFEIVTEVAKRHAADKRKQRFHGEVAEVSIGGHKTLLVWPHTFMNRSGSSAHEVLSFFKLGIEDLLVVCDDMNLPVGKLRFRPQGSAGGQKGLADVIRRLGTDEVSRLRIGIGQPPDGWEGSDYVLSKFTKQEKEEIEIAVMRAADGVCDWVAEGTQFCMNRYNGSS